MERRGEDRLQWSRVTNLIGNTGPPSENHLHNFSSPENHLTKLTPLPENHRLQLSSPENHLGRVSMPENGLQSLPTQPEIDHYHPNSYQYRNIAMAESGILVNHGLPATLQDQILETSFTRLNLLSPSRRSPVPVLPQPPGSTLGGFPHLSYTSNIGLQRLRVQSAVRGQMGMSLRPNCVPVLENKSLDYDYGYGYGYDYDYNIMNSNLVNDYDYNVSNIMNGYQSSVAAINQFARSSPGTGNKFWLQGQRQLPLDSGVGYSVRPIRMNSDLRRRERPINGSQLGNSSSLMSSSNVNNLRRSRQCLSYSSLEELRGRISAVAKDQHGCRFLQKKLEEGKPEEIQKIFLEVKDHLDELMVDQFGNYLLQKLFEVCNEEQISQILLFLIKKEHIVMDICLDEHGTRVMQKLLEHLTTQEQISLAISVLRRITVTLTKSMNGHHVIQHCLKLFSHEENEVLLNEVADNCLDIATNKSGCCVLQQCVAHAQGEPRERLVAEVVANALVLSEHPFGNYVVQYILGMRIPYVTDDLLAQLVGNFVSLSMNKFASNVVEKCLKESAQDQSEKIIREIMNSPNFLMVLQDAYGNFVAQSAVMVSKGPLHNTLVSLIQLHYRYLHTNPYGKRVLDFVSGSSKHRV